MVEWIIRFVRFHGMQARADLFLAEPKIEAFLTNLAVRGNVASSTQNQAMNALVFLYKRVLNHTLEGEIDAVRANRLTRSRVYRAIGRLRHLAIEPLLATALQADNLSMPR